MSILTRLFGSSPPSGTPHPTLRSLLKARTPPWHRVPPIAVDAIFEALNDTELFDCFVRASIENNLVPEYERLDQNDVSIIRSRISEILCKTGLRKISQLRREVLNRRMDEAKNLGLAISDLFEPAIAFSKNQIAGYLGMATVYDLLGVKGKSHEYAKLGLFELDKVKQSEAGQAMRESAVFPANMLESTEMQLRGYLSSGDGENEIANKSVAGKNFLPAAFIVLAICFQVIIGRRPVIQASMTGIVGGIIMIAVASFIARLFRKHAPIWANRIGIALYWVFSVLALLTFVFFGGSLIIGEIKADAPGSFLFLGVVILPLLYWVIGLGARRALTARSSGLVRS
jgi:hypothetical protein